MNIINLFSYKVSKIQQANVKKKLYWAAIICIFISFASCGKGCCSADVNVNTKNTSGSAVLEVQNLIALAPATGSSFVSVSFSGNLLLASDGTGLTTFSVTITCKVTGTGVTPAPLLNRVNLKPGTWEMRVTAGNWSTTCQGTIEKELGKTFTYTYGNQGCSVH